MPFILLLKRSRAREVPGLLINAWYLDDGTLCGCLDDLASALAIIEAEGPARGLHLNRSKSLLHAVADIPINNPHFSNIPCVSGGFDLLCTPLGPAADCEATLLKRVHKVLDVLSKLGDLQDSQMEATLLRSCLALPKMTYVLRICPPDHITTALSAFDDNWRQALSDLAGSPLSDWSWLKASLPPSLGSFHQRKPLISKILGHPPKQPSHLPSILSALVKAAARPEWCSINEIDIPLFQHCLSHAIDEASFSALVDTAPDARSKALALSSAIPHAGDWLNVVPSSALGLCLQDQEFRLCLQYWDVRRWD